MELLGPDVSGAASVPVRVSLDRRRLEECAGAVRRQMREIVRRAVVDVAGLKWELLGEVILVGGQTLMPAVRRDLQELTGRRPYTVEQPQLAVALGAATYAHILSLGRERFHENTLINVLALALGIRLDDNTFEQLVPANATVPYTSRPFAVTTTEDNQTFIRVEVLQGSRHARGADECVVLARAATVARCWTSSTVGCSPGARKPRRPHLTDQAPIKFFSGLPSTLRYGHHL